MAHIDYNWPDNLPDVADGRFHEVHLKPLADYYVKRAKDMVCTSEKSRLEEMALSMASKILFTEENRRREVLINRDLKKENAKLWIAVILFAAIIAVMCFALAMK